MRIVATVALIFAAMIVTSLFLFINSIAPSHLALLVGACIGLLFSSFIFYLINYRQQKQLSKKLQDVNEQNALEYIELKNKFNILFPAYPVVT